MSFLDSVSIPGGATPTVTPTTPASTGGFLNSVKLPTAAQTARVNTANNIGAQAATSRVAANQAGSFGGMALNTLKGLWPASGIPEQAEQGAQQANDTSNPGPEGTLGRLSGIATVLSSPLAPVFKPVGQVINKVGTALANTRSPAQNAMLEKFANSPAGVKTSRVATDVANAANVTGTILGGIDAVHGFTPKVKGGFLDTTETPATPKPPEGEPPGAPPTAKPVVKTPAQAHAEYATKMGYEPYTPHDQLPVIQTGPKADNGLPSIQTEAPKTPAVKGDLTVHPVEETPKPTPTSRAGEPTTKTVTEAAKPEVPYSTEKPGEPGYKPLSPVESTGETRTPTLSTKVNANYDHDEVKDLPGYNKANWDQQRSFAQDILTNEPDKALRIATTEEAPPPHVLASAVFKEVEDQAMAKGDGETMTKLAQSPIALERTRMGQEIGYLSQRSDLSPVDKIQEVAEAREGDAKVKSVPRRLSRETPALQRSIRESAPTKDDWSKFIDDIKCGY